MKKLFYRLAVCLCVIGGFVGCSKDDEPGGGEGAMYQVTVQQSGDFRSYIKSVVVTANGISVINENTMRSSRVRRFLMMTHWLYLPLRFPLKAVRLSLPFPVVWSMVTMRL